MDLPSEKTYCHHTGFTKKCRALVVSEKCNRWMHIRGLNPNTGDPIDHFNCIDNWMPSLMIENSLQQRQTGAAVESFRNEMVKLNTQYDLKLVNGR